MTTKSTRTASNVAAGTREIAARSASSGQFVTKEAAPAKRAAQGGARSTTGRAVRKAATAKRAAPAIAVGSDVGGHRASADLGKVTADFVAALAPENVVQPEADSSVARLLEAVERLRQLMSGRRIDVDPQPFSLQRWSGSLTPLSRPPDRSRAAGS